MDGAAGDVVGAGLQLEEPLRQERRGGGLSREGRRDRRRRGGGERTRTGRGSRDGLVEESAARDSIEGVDSFGAGAGKERGEGRRSRVGRRLTVGDARDSVGRIVMDVAGAEAGAGWTGTAAFAGRIEGLLDGSGSPSLLMISSRRC